MQREFILKYAGPEILEQSQVITAVYGLSVIWFGATGATGKQPVFASPRSKGGSVILPGGERSPAFIILPVPD